MRSVAQLMACPESGLGFLLFAYTHIEILNKAADL